MVNLWVESVNITSFRIVLMNLLITSMIRKATTSSVTNVETTLCGTWMIMNVSNVRMHSLDVRCAWERNATCANIMESSLLI